LSDDKPFTEEVSKPKARTTQIEPETKAVAARDHFISLAATIKKDIIARLQVASTQQSQRLSVSVVCQAGSQLCQVLLNELEELLKSAGIETQKKMPIMVFSKRPLPPVRLRVNPADSTIANNIGIALVPLFPREQMLKKIDEKIKRGALQIEIHGDPLFNLDGTVKFR